jgi:hypothetical protein
MLLLLAAGLLLFPGTYRVPYLCLGLLDIAGGVLLAAIWVIDYRRREEPAGGVPVNASAIPAREQ